jgi:glycosidase
MRPVLAMLRSSNGASASAIRHSPECSAMPSTIIRRPRLNSILRLFVALSVALLFGPAKAAAGAEPAPPGNPPLAAPDWRDQIIYFLMIDRFDDGDPANNDQGAGEYDPADSRKFSGGDLDGIRHRIDYIRELGATAVWITPPVSNQWWDGRLQYGGYHGYWAADFRRVDRHFGSLDSYRALARALHGAGMALIQDIVVNHTGNFFHYEEWNAAQPAQGWRSNPDSRPMARPLQWPLNLNDPRDPAQREAAIYHFTPSIRDHAERDQELRFQLSDLDDLNTGNAVVRDLLRDAYGFWIREVGVDGYRVDTAFYVPEAFFTDFLYADDAERPGILRVAAASGHERFHVFGEGFALDRPYEDTQARRIESYVGDGERLPSMINFPLYGALQDVFAGGQPSAVLGHRIGSMMQVHANPHLMPTFIDNHDVDRFLAGGSEAGLRQALLALMTLPGIPTLYYGTEQGFRERRAAMFAGGWGSGGRDRFDRDVPLYRYLQQVTGLRHAQPALRRGCPTVLADNGSGPGPVAWRMEHGDDALLIAFNTAAEPVLLDIPAGQLAAGSRLHGLFSIDGDPPVVDAASDGRLLRVLPAHAGLVWRIDPPAATSAPATRAQAPPARITIDSLPARIDADLVVSGRAEGVSVLRLVVDDLVERAIAVEVAEDGRWQARLSTADLVDPSRQHRLLAWSPDAGIASAAHAFRVERRWQMLLDVVDPAGDDHGPDARYRYPTASRWRDARPADILGARVWQAGNALRLDLRMQRLVAGWNPANGFDHVAFTVFVELPGRSGGQRVMPLQNAELPGDMRWHWRLRANGWSNVLFAADGADADNEGRPAGQAVALAVDADTHTVSFHLPAALFNGLDSLSGLRIHVTTWDYDGRYRALQPEAGSHAFGGGDGERDPLVMDALTITLP